MHTVDSIEVRDPDPHRMYLVMLDRDVVDADGNIAIPAGSPARLIIHDVGGLWRDVKDAAARQDLRAPAPAPPPTMVPTVLRFRLDRPIYL